MIGLVTKPWRYLACFGNRLLVLHLWLAAVRALAGGSAVEHDVQNKRVTLSDPGHNLVLRLSYDGRCLLDQVSVHGRQVVSRPGVSPAAGSGVCSAIKLGDQWFTTRAGIATPQVKATSNRVTIAGIRFGP